MQKTLSDDLNWTAWPADTTVEYQISDDFVRIRRWENGSATVSEWLKWDQSTDWTIRRQLRALSWASLPKHQRKAANDTSVESHELALYDWLRQHVVKPFAARRHGR